ncbi:hypothetical protein [Nitrosomonas marina]|uniref:PD(D/E)XK endonuclease domain-containing protein n=1 Tax=Nitrosomonas marina TaxID=917 RepID=A0A1H8IL31_9PROT|nr:hypothetical protein [Nitrosomonas marina]SEN69214.1 hypothetical protein SAMN05216325_1357 [Nitrosomonas marina]
MNSNDKSSRGNASQFFVAGELCRRGWPAVVTLGNTPNTDVLVTNIEGTKFVHVQVKTFVPGNATCSVGRKAEIDFGANFFWILVGIPYPNTKSEFSYYIIPSSDMAQNVAVAHRKWLADPGLKGNARKDSNVRTVHLPPRTSYSGWDISSYHNRWDLIEAKLRAF